MLLNCQYAFEKYFRRSGASAIKLCVEKIMTSEDFFLYKLSSELVKLCTSYMSTYGHVKMSEVGLSRQCLDGMVEGKRN